MDKNTITVETFVKVPMSKVWEYWNKPEHILNWAFASDDWEVPGAENDLRVGGQFKTTMAAVNESQKFDFGGTYTVVKANELIEYDLDDGRHVIVKFVGSPEGVKIVQTFEPENENSQEFQRSGWQAILNNFKKYVEGSN